VTRRDLHPGAQASQLTHAAQQFEKEHFDVQNEWYSKSNHLVLLSCENEESLKQLFLKANIKGIKASAFIEPDMDNQLTAIAFEPGEDTCKLCSSLPLAFKEFTEAFKQFHGKEVAHGN
jgi:peptidyl-tRNA hydrolase